MSSREISYLMDDIKPSKRIIFRKLTLNLRIILGISFFVLQFLNEFISAYTSQNNIYDFLVDLADSTNLLVIILTVLLILLFFYLVVLLITNVGAMIWGYLNYLTMHNYVNQNIVHIKKGVIFKKDFEVPIPKLTNIRLNISILDRILGTADVECITAGGANIYILETLSQPNAREIQQFLLKQIGVINTRIEETSASFLTDPRVQAELREIRQLLNEVFV